MSQGQHPTDQLLVLGIAQAAGFLVGALLGRWLGLALGFDALGAGYGNNVIVGNLLD